MVLTPNSSAELAKSIRDVYSDAEELILTRLARQLAKGITEETWLDRKYADLQTLNTQLDRLLADLADGVPGAVERVMQMAYNRGTAAAVADLNAAGVGVGATAAPPVPVSVTAFTQATIESLGNVPFRVRRWTNDVYSQVTRETAAQILTGTMTRRDASAAALKRYAARGVTGFIDRGGKQWDMISYSEMAARTTASQASLEGHTRKLQDLGQDLVQISDAPGECKICRPFEGQVLSISGDTTGTLSDGTTVKGTLRQATSEGLFHANCFPGDVLVESPTGVRAGDTRWVDSEVVVINTASGNELTVTPNHPILTPEGWVAAGEIKVGGSVISYLGGYELPVVDSPDDKSVPSPIGEVFHALRGTLGVTSSHMPASPEQFHGDGEGSDVEVVWSDRLLSHHFDPEVGHGFADKPLIVGGVDESTLASEGAEFPLGHTGGSSAGGVMGGSDLAGSLGFGHAGPLEPFGIGPASTEPVLDEVLGEGDLSSTELRSGLCLAHARLIEGDSLSDPRGTPPLGSSEAGGFTGGSSDSELSEPLVQAGGTDSDHARQVRDSLAGSVAVDDVVNVEVRNFAGHVYNLESGDGWYVANSIVVHNCRHRQQLYLPGVSERLTDTADPKGDEQRQRQRAYERRVRGWKRRVIVDNEIYGKDSPAAKATRKKLAAARSEMNAFIESNDLKKLPYRVSLNAR